MMDSAKALIISAIDTNKDRLHAISNTIFTNPELNFEEKIAHEYLVNILENEGFSVEKHFKMDTSFRATFCNVNHTDFKGKVPNIAFLCEYDALPEIGHACGHNLIAEAGIAASLGIKALLSEQPSEFQGKVTVLGCPAEEGGGGKIKLIEAGAFDDIQVAMMTHPSVANIAMPKLPAITSLTVAYSGSASHACTAPWQGVNALDAAVMAYQNLAVLRQQCRPDWRLSAIISQGGTETYIIPERAEMKVAYRALSTTDQQQLGEKVENCLKGASLATGCHLEINYAEDSYKSMLHNKTLANIYEEFCDLLGVEMCQDSDQTGALVFSTDMGDVSHVVPSIHPVYTIGTAAANHTTQFAECAGSTMAQVPTLLQAKALALTAAKVIKDQDLRNKIQEEFIQSNH